MVQKCPLRPPPKGPNPHGKHASIRAAFGVLGLTADYNPRIDLAFYLSMECFIGSRMSSPPTAERAEPAGEACIHSGRFRGFGSRSSGAQSGLPDLFQVNVFIAWDP